MCWKSLKTRRDKVSLKRHILNHLLEMMTGPSGVVPILLAVMTHGETLAAFNETSHPTCEILVLVYLLRVELELTRQ